MVARARNVLAARIYRAMTRWPPERLGELVTHPAARQLSGPASSLLTGTWATVPGGPGAGLRLSLPTIPLTHQQAHFLVRGTIEPDVQEALRRTVSPGMTIWDIGANIGYFSLLSARLTGPSGAVHCFEPLPRSVRAIRENCALNAFDHVRVHQIAAGAKSETAHFLEVREASWSHLGDRGPHTQAIATLDVQVAALDELVQQAIVGRPSVVKIDVEGSELEVLRGMRRTIEDCRPVVICETHGTTAELADHLPGYSLENLDGPDELCTQHAVHVLARPAL